MDSLHWMCCSRSSRPWCLPETQCYFLFAIFPWRFSSSLSPPQSLNQRCLCCFFLTISIIIFIISSITTSEFQSKIKPGRQDGFHRNRSSLSIGATWVWNVKIYWVENLGMPSIIINFQFCSVQKYFNWYLGTPSILLLILDNQKPIVNFTSCI